MTRLRRTDPENGPPMPAVESSVPAYADAWASAREHFERGTLERGLPTLRVPAIFIAGAASPIAVERSRGSAALVPGARLEVLEGCGHMPWLERPGSVARTIPAA